MIRGVALGAAALVFGLVASAQAGDRPKAVIELFTSQGCSSCPAADALLAELTDEPGLIALSLPVDYWDYLGWRDTLASAENTKRQRAYAAARGTRKVYTPQVVANGLTRAIGSHREAIEAAIEAAGPGDATLIADARLTLNGGSAKIEIGAGKAPAIAEVALVWIDKRVSVRVKRGENAGKELTYSNVVRKIKPVGTWSGAPTIIDAPDVTLAPGQMIAVLVQARRDGKLGAIYAADLAD